MRSFLTLQGMKPSIILALALGLSSFTHAADVYTVAVIPKGSTHEHWKTVHAGAIKAQRELKARGMNVEVMWQAPLREDDRDYQMRVVENLVARRVNGICIAPLDSKALVAPVNTASRAKIPVIVFDSALKSDKPISYISTDNYKGGVLGAEHLGKLLGGKGNVILLRYAIGSAATEEREAGFLDTLKAKFPGLKLISSDQYGGATRETAYQVSQNLLNRHGKNADGIFCPNETTTIGMTMALRNIGRAGGTVKLVGFDVGTAAVEAMKKGDVQGLVVQNPLRMGYDCVMTMADHWQGKKVPEKIDTGVFLITPENINDAEMQKLIKPPLDEYLK
jgi:ribose transport system substrate-binding protein